jgi:hypothetical protein
MGNRGVSGARETWLRFGYERRERNPPEVFVNYGGVKFVMH